MNLNIANIDIVNLFKQVKLEMEEKITEANLDFRLDIPEDKVIVALDGQKTYRIFENLIGNASKIRNASYEGICENCGRRRGCGVPDEKMYQQTSLHLTQRRSRNVLSEGIRQEIPKDLDLTCNRQKFRGDSERKILD